MSSNSSNRLKEQNRIPIFLVEVVNAEKHLWTLIHSKGLLCSEVKDLYRKSCSSYEKIVLDDHDLSELQDVEYSIWKLHYKHIDEFRKRIKRSSANADITTFAMPKGCANMQRSNENHIEGFKSFLLEAMEYYRNLMEKVKRNYGILEECYFYDWSSTSNAEPKKLQKCQFLCHRFLVCLGDLARYKEQYEKFGSQDQNWSIAATHYLEATKIWPDSGNPQNQLAVLAFYVGDELAALYHCVRSLAVKEPFPDAGNNLILLFERNSSSDLHSLCSETCFDFLNPSERTSVKVKSQTSDDFSNLWSLIIRTMSFFFIKSSLKDFPCAFASTMRELDAMMVVDDTKLKATLESFQFMDSARTGPFRALQVVAIFIFIIQDLLSRVGKEGPEDKNDMQQQLESIRFALTAAFIFMGRLFDRCLKSSPLDSCPLLPAVLVFVEWLAGIPDEAETHEADDKCVSAMSYFFGVLVELLQQLNARGEVSSPERTALWEDYELRGFAPVTYSQMSLDFSTHCGHFKNFESGNDCRAGRIINAAIKIANRSNGARKWITYDQTGAKFYAESNINPVRRKSEVELTSDFKVKDTHQSMLESRSKSVVMEEEEVIVFKPLTRYNSAPLHNIDMKESELPKDINEQIVPPDECLRRATSHLIAQNPTQGDPFAFHSDITNFRPFKQQEPLVKDTGAHPLFRTSICAGPPSLSAWVFDRGSVNNDRGKGRRSDMSKPGLSPIEEIVSASLSGLSISGTEDSSVISSGQPYASSHYSSPYWAAPVPSAPLLPENAKWFNDVQPSFSELKNSEGINRTDGFSDPLHISSYPNWNATPGPLNYSSAIPGFMDGYTPFRGMTSSEWLRQYRENQNLEQANSYSRPLHFYAPRNPGSFQCQDASRLDPFLQWQAPAMTTNQMIYSESPPMHSGFPQVRSAEEHRRDKLFHGYQRPTLYGCGGVTDFRDEPQPLLQYLKEKEWLLQKDPTLRGPSTYMGN